MCTNRLASRSHRPSKITIAIVLGGLGLGGNETWAVSFLSRLNRDFFSPIVISLSKATGPTEASLESFDVPITKIPIADYSPLGFIWKFSRVISDKRVDSVLSTGFSKQHLLIHAGAVVGGARVRLSRVSATPPDARLRRKLKWLQWASRFVCTYEIAVSNSVAAWIKSFGGYPSERIRVIPNGCDISSIRARADLVRKNAGLRPKRVIMVARLEKAKDHETLLRAMVLVRHVLPDVELLLVGDGPRRQHLQGLAARIDSGVRFLGSRQDVPELLASADVFVLSTHTEGFGIALIEAMAAGLPVIASDIPACREIVDNGRAGLLFPSGGSTILAEHLMMLLRDSSAHRTYKEAAITRSSFYSISSMVSKYESVIRQEI
jgi:glycosyltransferase involved in cell wall biosynthesis